MFVLLHSLGMFGIELRKIAESADDLDVLTMREAIQCRFELVPRGFILFAVEADRGPANVLDGREDRLASWLRTVSPRMRPRRRISSRSGKSLSSEFSEATAIGQAGAAELHAHSGLLGWAT